MLEVGGRGLSEGGSGINMAHGGMAMLLALVTLACFHQQWNYGLAVAVTAVAAIAMGIAIDLSIMRPLRNRPPLDSAVASLGLLLTLQGLAVIIFRSEEHTSELQSHLNLVCRLLLEKKKYTYTMYTH